MRSTSRIFTASAVFFFIVDAVYGFVSHEIAGTIMFGLWCVTLLFAALFLGTAAKRGAPDGDDPDLRPEDRAGRPIGVFSRGSGWPIVLAAGLTVGLAGLVYGTWLLIPGTVVTIAALLGLMRETAAA
jgi:Cytochrome c oxidase subunit IV